MRLWSPARLRNGVHDWEEITPEPLRSAIAALRREFATNAWKVGEIMRQGSHPALHKGMADQARTIHEGVKKLGYPALLTVDEGQTEPSVFTAHFDCSASLLAREVRGTFSDLFDIASAHSGLLSSDPISWASLQTKVLVADESHRIPLWTKDACDKQPYDPSGDPDEAIYWTKWRAPKWFFMRPFANRPYDAATSWERMDEGESKHLLEVVEDRFNQRLIMALEKAVDETHVRLAKQAGRVEPDRTDGKRALLQSEPWRDFRAGFQSLADEEWRENAAQRDRFLRAYCNYNEHPEILHEKGKPGQGPFCLLKRPETGLWIVSDGVNENFQARFRTLAARAGLALGSPKGTDPEDFWLHRLFLDLRENNSDQLFAASKEGGVILRVCVASATFCSRLERQALAQAEPDKQQLPPSQPIERGIAEATEGRPAFDHDENLRNAILQKKARVAEIERILNRPPLAKYRGQPVHGGQNWRLRLEEERQHLLIAVLELERELERLNQAGISRGSSTPTNSDLPSNAPKSEEFLHSDDYRSVTVRGQNLTLTSRQAHVIQILDENRRNGLPDVGKDYLLEKLETPNSRLRDSFKSNFLAWKVLVKTGTKKGTVRLNV
jgi:hypothetical protein